MFCIMLEMTPTVPEMRIMMRLSLAPASLMMGPATWFITPVLSRPAPMMMTAMIEQTALLLSPTKACLGAMRPSIGSRTIIRTPTTSTLIHSETNSHTAKARTTIVSIISGVMRAPSVYSAGPFLMFSFRNRKQIRKTRTTSDSLKKKSRSIVVSRLGIRYTGV